MRHTDFVHSKKADGMMLAMVTQTFALDLFENEQVRRRKEGRAPVSRIQFREV